MALQEVRRDLLEAGLALFVDQGYDAVSVDRIRRAAGVSNGSFFHAFASKAELAAELLADCVGEYQAAVVAALADRPDAEAGVAGMVGAKLRWVSDNRERARFMLDDARSQWFALAAGRLTGLNAAFVAEIERWRAPLLAAGILHPMPAEAFAAVLLGPANMLCRMWLAGLKPDLGSPLRYEAELASAACRALVVGTVSVPRPPA